MDLCKNPEFICSTNKHSELKWIAGLFYWLTSVQDYHDSSYPNYNYFQEVKEFVDGNMVNTKSFIDKVSGIVNRGCPASTCSTGEVDGADERQKNFEDILKVMGF